MNRSTARRDRKLAGRMLRYARGNAFEAARRLRASAADNHELARDYAAAMPRFAKAAKRRGHRHDRVAERLEAVHARRTT